MMTLTEQVSVTCCSWWIRKPSPIFSNKPSLIFHPHLLLPTILIVLTDWHTLWCWILHTSVACQMSSLSGKDYVVFLTYSQENLAQGFHSTRNMLRNTEVTESELNLKL